MNRLPWPKIQVATLVLAGTLACSKGDAPRADSAATLAKAAAPRPKVMPAALTKPLEQYSADEFADLVKKQVYVGAHEKGRPCRDKPDCDTKVTVDAIETQDSLSLGTVPQFGVVYIHGINKGKDVEARYGLKPGPKYDYYWIITADTAQKTMRWQLEELDTTPNAMKLTTTASGPFGGCNHAWVAGARADFKTCAMAAASHDSVVHLGLTLQGGIGDPIWVSCSQGCCVDTGDGGPGTGSDTGMIRGRGRGRGRGPGDITPIR